MTTELLPAPRFASALAYLVWTFALATFAPTCRCLAQSEEPRATGPAPLLPSEALLDDVRILRRIYEALHPGLYRYSTKAQMEGHWRGLSGEFARDRTLGDAYLAFSRFLARVKCGHTYANFNNQDPVIAAQLFGGQNRLPFQCRWIDGRMIVTRDLSPVPTLPAGTEVVSIDGIACTELLARVLPLVRADGGNDARRLDELNLRGQSRYEAFDVFLPLVHPSLGARLRLEVRRPGAAEATIVAATAQTDQDRATLAQATGQPQGSDALWRFESRGSGIAYLRMATWAVYDSKWDWRSFLDQGIDRLIEQGTKHLILDLRGNGGGLDVGNILLARIAQAPIRVGRVQRFTRYRSVPAELLPYLKTWDPSFKDWGDAAVPAANGFFRLTKYDDDTDGDAIVPKGKRFAGELIVLIDASNSSATGQFAQLVREQRLGRLVGQTTGGNQRGINGGAFFFVTLPNSKIEVDLPLIARFPAAEGLPDGSAIPFPAIADAGVDPDVRVLVTADDIARGIDPELEAALKLCGGR